VPDETSGSPAAPAKSGSHEREEKMKLVDAIVTVKPEKTELYEATFHRLKKYVHENEPRTPFFELCKDIDEPYVYHVFEAYADEAALAEHVNSAFYLETARVFMQCLAGDHMEQAAKLGLTEPRDIYPLCKGLRALRYETL
jgi:quinol monooxygenase YgiN